MRRPKNVCFQFLFFNFRDHLCIVLEESDEEADDEFAELSRFEREQQRIQKQITELEEFNVGDKPWQLIGGLIGSDGLISP